MTKRPLDTESIWTKPGDTWVERSVKAGPEYLPCPACSAEWNPVFVAWVRRHRNDCTYAADVARSSKTADIPERDWQNWWDSLSDATRQKITGCEESAGVELTWNQRYLIARSGES